MTANMDEKVAAPVLDSKQQSSSTDIQIGDLIEVSASAEEEAKVLRKIDRLYASRLFGDSPHMKSR